MRTGKDNEDTHESMQVNRHIRKYLPGLKKRHIGENRRRHRNDEDDEKRLVP